MAEVFRTAQRLHRAGTSLDLAALDAAISDEALQRGLRELALKAPPVGEQSPAECVRELKHVALKRQMAEIQRRLEGAPQDRLEALFQEMHRLKRLIRSL